MGRNRRRSRAIADAGARRIANGVVGAILALLFGVIAVGWATDVAKLRGVTNEADAKVVDVLDEGRSTLVDVEFVAASGERIETSTEEFDHDPMPKVGDRIRIVYVPDDPELVAEVGSVPDYFLPIACGLGALLSAGYVILTFTPWIPPWLRDL